MKKQKKALDAIVGVLVMSFVLVLFAIYLSINSYSDPSFLKTQLASESVADLELEAQVVDTEISLDADIDKVSDVVAIQEDSGESEDVAYEDDYYSYNETSSDDIASGNVVNNPQLQEDLVAPESGPAENLVLIFAAVLGLLGAAIFLAIKLKNYH